jgi:hypothetical protein
VLLEALALGVPVVALAELGTREIVLPQRGTIAALDDPARLAADVAAVLKDPERRQRMAVDACAFAQEWRTDAIAARMREIYAGAVRPGGAPTPVRQSVIDVEPSTRAGPGPVGGLTIGEVAAAKRKPLGPRT